MATKQEIAADAMIAMAADGSIGYSQGAARTGLRGHSPAEVRAGLVTDTDCSFSVAWALWWAELIPESVLYDVIYTGNQASVYAQYGASNLSWDSVGIGGLQTGDVLLSNGHTAMVVPFNGGLGIAEASINEIGDILGGQLGDQTGGETKVGPLRRGNWHTVQRFPISQSSKTLNGSSEEAEIMAAKDEILKAIDYVNTMLRDRVNVLRQDMSYQNSKIGALQEDLGKTKAAVGRLEEEVAALKTQIDNVNKGLGYQNQVYLSPTKEAVSRIDKS